MSSSSTPLVVRSYPTSVACFCGMFVVVVSLVLAFGKTSRPLKALDLVLMYGIPLGGLAILPGRRATLSREGVVVVTRNAFRRREERVSLGEIRGIELHRGRGGNQGGAGSVVAVLDDGKHLGLTVNEPSGFGATRRQRARRRAIQEHLASIRSGGPA